MARESSVETLDFTYQQMRCLFTNSDGRTVDGQPRGSFTPSVQWPFGKVTKVWGPGGG